MIKAVEIIGDVYILQAFLANVFLFACLSSTQKIKYIKT